MQGPKKQKRESEIIAANRRFFFEEWCPTGFRDVELVTLFSSDVPGQLGNYANEIDASLIIMPTNQKNFVTRFLLGSVASMVVRASPCPTLVVKNTPVVILDQSSSDNAHQKNP